MIKENGVLVIFEFFFVKFGNGHYTTYLFINKITNYFHFLSSKTGKSLIKGVVDTFALHEGQPGHHMQITIKNDLTTLPDFLRYDVGSIGLGIGVTGSQLPKYAAFIEGWGLYSEYLGYVLFRESNCCIFP